jgi:hypothetical protein
MIAIFDEDGSGTVDFQEFIAGLSAFSSKGNKEEKLRCNVPPSRGVCGWRLIIVAFKVYDMDRDGYISNGELFIVLKMMVGNNLKDQQLQQVLPYCRYSDCRLWIRRLWRRTRMGTGRFRLTSFVKWLLVRYDTYRVRV